MDDGVLEARSARHLFALLVSASASSCTVSYTAPAAAQRDDQASYSETPRRGEVLDSS